MQSKTKSIIIIVSALILGVILGVLTNGMFMHHQHERLIGMRHKAGFTREFEHVVNPADEQQSEKIRDILDDFHQEFRTLGDGHFEEIQMLFDSLKSRLEPTLSEEQIKRLNQHHEKMRFCKKGKICKPPNQFMRHKQPIFEKFDADGDGAITKEEFEDFHNQKQRKERR
ncbi:hypothetical protein H8D59_01940 [bacterium]|nr:hypothetical protein [bacterium]